ncbi:hypothetical protein BK652_17925 [Pseudomonas brassicacearum]|uniref:Uncharacterized protein n=3 Tax=Pseudomonas TaxID=286 RepID=A0A0G3G947_9PSED|nr:hypothetical protein VM99_06470 [Pseudomonas chlororaphis]KIQ61108.1 hypothetical protein RL74_01905 [Pseudomonas fluorescens]ROM80534.1 hypothetical protein BK652_17925 [Pseudomonas brassicacearum]
MSVTAIRSNFGLFGSVLKIPQYFEDLSEAGACCFEIRLYFRAVKPMFRCFLNRSFDGAF